MARSFDGVDDLINVGTGTSLANLNPFTICAWVHLVDSGPNYPRVYSKEPVEYAGIEFDVRRAAPAGGIFLRRAQTTTEALYSSVAGVIPFSLWQFVAVQYRSSTSPRIRMFKGTPTSLAAEVAYDIQQDGVGTPTDDSTSVSRIGSDVDIAASWSGRLAYVIKIAAFLTLAEIQSIQFGIIPAHVFSDVKGFWPLWGVASPEPDLSGNGNNGTVTGAVQADGPPVGPYVRRARSNLWVLDPGPAGGVVVSAEFADVVLLRDLDERMTIRPREQADQTLLPDLMDVQIGRVGEFADLLLLPDGLDVQILRQREEADRLELLDVLEQARVLGQIELADGIYVLDSVDPPGAGLDRIEVWITRQQDALETMALLDAIEAVIEQIGPQPVAPSLDSIEAWILRQRDALDAVGIADTVEEFLEQIGPGPQPEPQPGPPVRGGGFGLVERERQRRRKALEDEVIELIMAGVL